MEGKFRDFTAEQIVEYIKLKKAKSDDEWLEIETWINEFLKNNPSEEEKKLFIPLGWAESVCVVCDGIKRWRKSICYRCKRREDVKYSCEIYKKSKNSDKGIPSEIWAGENAECPHFKR